MFQAGALDLILLLGYLAAIAKALLTIPEQLVPFTSLHPDRKPTEQHTAEFEPGLCCLHDLGELNLTSLSLSFPSREMGIVIFASSLL